MWAITNCLKAQLTRRFSWSVPLLWWFLCPTILPFHGFKSQEPITVFCQWSCLDQMDDFLKDLSKKTGEMHSSTMISILVVGVYHLPKGETFSPEFYINVSSFWKNWVGSFAVVIRPTDYIPFAEIYIRVTILYICVQF